MKLFKPVMIKGIAKNCANHSVELRRGKGYNLKFKEKIHEK